MSPQLSQEMPHRLRPPPRSLRKRKIAMLVVMMMMMMMMMIGLWMTGAPSPSCPSPPEAPPSGKKRTRLEDGRLATT